MCFLKKGSTKNNLNFYFHFSSFVDNCLNDGVGTSQEHLPLQVKGIK
jgi:hypothetical protein